MEVDRIVTRGLTAVKRWLDRWFPEAPPHDCFACGSPLAKGEGQLLGGRWWCDGYCKPATWTKPNAVPFLKRDD